MKPAFHENLVSPSATSDTSYDFDWDAVYAALGEPTGDEKPSPAKVAALLYRAIGNWTVQGIKIGSPGSLAKIGRRYICFLWVVNPSRFDGHPISLRQLASRLGVHESKLYPITADASRTFGISNEFQSHAPSNEQ